MLYSLFGFIKSLKDEKMRLISIVFFFYMSAFFASSVSAQDLESYNVKATVELHEKVSDLNQAKKIVVFFDGTGDNMQQRSNVIKLFEISANQKIDNADFYYHKGVGTGEKFIGAATGLGMGHIVKNAYAFLSQRYEKGTKLYVFGFSRGAFTSRVFTNFIDTVGLYNLKGIDTKKAFKLIDSLYANAYKGKDKTKDQIKTLANKIVQKYKADTGIKKDISSFGSVEIEILGLWDTVAALGLKVENKKQNIINYYDTYFDQICNTKHVLQALSLDDNRANIFTPVIISADYFKSKCQNKEDIDIKSVVNEVWFSGAHSDVGGGYETKTSLSGVALNWMISEIKKIESDFLPKSAEVFQNEYGYSHKASDHWYDVIAFGKTTRGKIIEKYVDLSVYKKLRVHQSVIDKIQNPDLWDGYSSKWYESDKFKECFKKADKGYTFMTCELIEVVK